MPASDLILFSFLFFLVIMTFAYFANRYRKNKRVNHLESELETLKDHLSHSEAERMIQQEIIFSIGNAFHRSKGGVSEDSIEHFSRFMLLARLLASPESAYRHRERISSYVTSISPEVLSYLLDEAEACISKVAQIGILGSILENEAYYIGAMFHPTQSPEVSYIDSLDKWHNFDQDNNGSSKTWPSIHKKTLNYR